MIRTDKEIISLQCDEINRLTNRIAKSDMDMFIAIENERNTASMLITSNVIWCTMCIITYILLK